MKFSTSKFFEDRSEGTATYLRLDVDGERGKVSLEPNCVRRQRAREVDEALSIGSHAGQD